MIKNSKNARCEKRRNRIYQLAKRMPRRPLPSMDSQFISEQERNDWGNLWPQALPKYIPEGFKIKEEVEPVYNETDFSGNMALCIISYTWNGKCSTKRSTFPARKATK